MVLKKRSRRRLSISEKMEKIRPYVDFDFKRPERVSAKNKSLIYRHFKVIEALEKNYHLSPIENPFKVGKKYGGTSFEEIQDDLNAEFKSVHGYTKKTRFKVFWVPQDLVGSTVEYDPIEQKFVFKKMGASIYYIYFEDRKELVENTREYVSMMISSVSDNATMRPLNPQGPFGSTPFGGKGGRFDKRAMIDEIINLETKYPDDFQDFMEGVEVTQF